MKHYRWLSLLLLTPLALGQGAPAASQAKPGTNMAAAASQEQRQEPQAAPAAKVPASQVPPTAAIITVQGLCPSTEASATRKTAAAHAAAKSANSPNCKTVITRAQFEKLANALNPDMPANTKRQLAEVYPRLLLFAQKARELGLNKDPQFQEMLQFTTMQLLAQSLTRDLQKRTGNIPEAEITKYYQDNPEKFQEIELLRIFIPKAKQNIPEAGAAAPPKAETAADQAAMKTVAEKIHAEAVSGTDFQKLQQEAFDAAAIKSQSPSVNLGKITREGLPTNHQQVFDLQAGQVSPLLDDPGGFYIYKVVSKQLVPLDQARGEIHNFLQQQAFRKQMDAMIGSVKPELNEAYFAGPAPRGQRAPNQPANKPPSGKPQAPPIPQ